MRPAPDTMAQLSALLPAAQGVAVWATLSRIADQARTAGDPRSRGQVMADTLVERITGQATAAAVPVTVNLVISDQALLGDDHEPAWLQGYGPIPADTIDPQTLTALRRLYATPATGALVGMESVAREFPAGLARLIDLRDRTCRTAVLRRPDPPPRPRHRPPPRRRNDPGQRPRPLRALQPHQTSPRLASQTRHRPTRPAPPDRHRPTDRPPDDLHRTRHADTEQPATDQPRRDPPQPDRTRLRRLRPDPLGISHDDDRYRPHLPL